MGRGKVNRDPLDEGRTRANPLVENQTKRKMLVAQIIWIVEPEDANFTEMLERLRETGAAKIENVEQRELTDREVSELTR